MGPKLRRLDLDEDDFFGPTLAYRRSAVGRREQQRSQAQAAPAGARPSHIA
jgi:hypothetical protein